MTECEKLRVGHEFLSNQSWSTNFYNEKHDQCYCSRCYQQSDDDTRTVGGQTYVIPRGWTRFGIQVDESFAQHHNVWTEWVNSYHGTSIENAKSIVEHRQLPLSDDIKLDKNESKTQSDHASEEYSFLTTPTINYASLNCDSYAYTFQSPTTKKYYKIKVVLQCKQKPDSFVVQGETVRAQHRICPYIPNDQIEWKSRQRSAIMPYGLMLLVTEINSIKADPPNSYYSNYQNPVDLRVVVAIMIVSSVCYLRLYRLVFVLGYLLYYVGVGLGSLLSYASYGLGILLFYVGQSLGIFLYYMSITISVPGIVCVLDLALLLIYYRYFYHRDRFYNARALFDSLCTDLRGGKIDLIAVGISGAVLLSIGAYYMRLYYIGIGLGLLLYHASRSLGLLLYYVGIGFGLRFYSFGSVIGVFCDVAPFLLILYRLAPQHLDDLRHRLPAQNRFR
ncbi:unnamed protein product [Adineta steineri]|uniref:Uncharacterized protein n=1 Tax=Adineta steineri TaxID=433720 RepID=A0A814PQ05_9BILA|nr:unnamed protein product [Adineta steineri]